MFRKDKALLEGACSHHGGKADYFYMRNDTGISVENPSFLSWIHQEQTEGSLKA